MDMQIEQTAYSEYDPTTGRMIELDANDPRLTARFAHSHECRDCGHSISCNGEEDRHGACLRWDGGNDGCDECNGPMPAYKPITAEERKAAMAARFAR